MTGAGAGPLYPDLQPGRERGEGGGKRKKKRMMGQKLKESDLNSPVFTSLQWKLPKMSCSLPRWLQIFLQLPDEKLKNTPPPSETSPRRNCTQRNRIRFQLAIMQSANNSQHNQMHTGTMCVHFPSRVQQSSYHLYTARGNFLCGSADEVSEQKRASNWISVLLLKVQLSMAKLGGSGVWILVSWCKRGTHGHICQPSAPDCTVCFS